MRILKKNQNYLVLIFLSSFIFNCKGQNTCSDLYNNYLDEVLKSNISSAEAYLNKAIECDSSNLSYKSEKVNFLIGEKRYNDALITIREIDLEPFNKVVEATLVLKLDSKNALKILKEAHSKLINFQLEDNDELIFSRTINLVMLENYLYGSEYALERVAKFDPKTTQHEEIIDFITNQMKSESPDTILFQFHNIQ